MFAFVSLESRVPPDHPLRRLKPVVDSVLVRMDPLFESMYPKVGRPSIAPERLLKAGVLMALYGVRSERQFCEQLGHNMLFQWFLDLDLSDEPFDHSSFSTNRERLLDHDVARQFFDEIVEEARQNNLVSGDHFSVDGTLVEAWASVKSFRPKNDHSDDNNQFGGFRGQKRRQRDPRVQDRPGGTTGAQGPGSGGQAGLHGSRTHGEPERAGRPLRGHGGQRPSGARHRSADARPREGEKEETTKTGQGESSEEPERTTTHARGRQGLRHARLRAWLPRAWRDSPCGPEPAPPPPLGHRPAHHTPLWLSSIFQGQAADREDLRLDEGLGRLPAKSLPGEREDARLRAPRGCHLQPDEDLQHRGRMMRGPAAHVQKSNGHLHACGNGATSSPSTVFFNSLLDNTGRPYYQLLRQGRLQVDELYYHVRRAGWRKLLALEAPSTRIPHSSNDFRVSGDGRTIVFRGDSSAFGPDRVLVRRDGQVVANRRDDAFFPLAFSSNLEFVACYGLATVDVRDVLSHQVRHRIPRDLLLYSQDDCCVFSADTRTLLTWHQSDTKKPDIKVYRRV